MPVGEWELVTDSDATQPWTALDTSADETTAIQARSLGAAAWRRPRTRKP